MTDIAEFLTQRENEREQVAIASGSGAWNRPCGHTPDQAAEIAMHDPAWMLADVAAKRAIIRAYEDRVGPAAESHPGYLTGEARGLRLALVALAQSHADHPDFDSAWQYEAVPQRWIVGPWISTAPDR